jgi:hypothetical protein
VGKKPEGSLIVVMRAVSSLPRQCAVAVAEVAIELPWVAEAVPEVAEAMPLVEAARGAVEARPVAVAEVVAVAAEVAEDAAVSDRPVFRAGSLIAPGNGNALEAYWFDGGVDHVSIDKTDGEPFDVAFRNGCLYCHPPDLDCLLP